MPQRPAKVKMLLNITGGNGNKTLKTVRQSNFKKSDSLKNKQPAFLYMRAHTI